MLTVIYWMEHSVPYEGARESTQGAKGVCNPIGGTTIVHPFDLAPNFVSVTPCMGILFPQKDYFYLT